MTAKNPGSKRSMAPSGPHGKAVREMLAGVFEGVREVASSAPPKTPPSGPRPQA